MAGDNRRKRDDGRRTGKKRQNASQDVIARKTGNTEARVTTKGGVPRAMKSGRQTTR